MEFLIRKPGAFAFLDTLPMRPKVGMGCQEPDVGHVITRNIILQYRSSGDNTENHKWHSLSLKKTGCRGWWLTYRFLSDRTELTKLQGKLILSPCCWRGVVNCTSWTSFRERSKDRRGGRPVQTELSIASPYFHFYR